MTLQYMFDHVIVSRDGTTRGVVMVHGDMRVRHAQSCVVDMVEKVRK